MKITKSMLKKLIKEELESGYVERTRGFDDWDAEKTRPQSQYADASDPQVIDALDHALWSVDQAAGLIKIMVRRLQHGGEGMPSAADDTIDGIIQYLNRATHNLNKAKPQ